MGVPRPEPGFGRPTMLIDAEPIELGFAALIACTETCAGFGITDGAVYKPALVMVPTVALPPVMPLTAQVTAVFELPETAAANCSVLDGFSVTEEGETITVTGGGGGG